MVEQNRYIVTFMDVLTHPGILRPKGRGMYPQEIQFILRTGYLKNYPQPVSLRRPIDWFIRS